METKKAVFTMRIDSKEKAQLKELYGDLGIDLSTAVNLFFKQSLASNGLPFQPNRSNKLNVEAREEAEHSNMRKFNSAKELMDDLTDED